MRSILFGAIFFLVLILAPAFLLGVTEIILQILTGALFISVSFFLITVLLEFYYQDYYFHTPVGVFEFYRIASNVMRGDTPVTAFVKSTAGSMFLIRAGAVHEYKNFSGNNKNQPLVKDMEGLLLEEETFSALCVALCKMEPALANAIATQGIHGDEDIRAIAMWVVREIATLRHGEWWWSEVNLSRFRGVGILWASPKTWKLDRYGTDIAGTHVHSPVFFTRHDEMNLLVEGLSQTSDPNVLLVGPAGIGKKELVRDFSGRVHRGEVPRHLANKRVVLLDGELLVGTASSKGELEERVLSVFTEALRARNVILAIYGFAQFIQSGKKYGTDIPALILRFIQEPGLPIIAISKKTGFHEEIERRRDLLNHFKVMYLEEPSKEKALTVLEEVVGEVEKKQGVIFTYPALKEIIEGANRYYSSTVFPQSAIEVAHGVFGTAHREGLSTITADVVEEHIREQTHIPVGKIKKEEKEKLLNLEKIIHERVIAQDEAVQHVADAVRRVRADISKQDGPIGTFLFLGPTGVGKTLTAKALAGAYFGGEKYMLRLDMNKYKEPGAISELIGSFETRRPGTLSALIRTNPYGVLLLDEFEKAHKDVQDLFLQIFDEGYFSDADGRKVNAKNILYIATSNAGSSIIFDAVSKGIALANMKDELVDGLISNGTLTPELVNRFDAVVLFHPLSPQNLREIVKRELLGLGVRLKEKNISLSINDLLIDTAIKYGYDPKYGARKMHRAIADRIENVVAKKIINGDIRSGQTVELTKEDMEGKT